LKKMNVEMLISVSQGETKFRYFVCEER